MGVGDGEGGEVAGEGDVGGGHVVIEGVDGGGFDDADACAEWGDGDGAEGLAEELDGAFLRPEVGSGEAEEGGFSAAVGAEDGGDLVGEDGPADIGEDGASEVGGGAGEGDVLEGEDGIHKGASTGVIERIFFLRGKKSWGLLLRR